MDLSAFKIYMLDVGLLSAMGELSAQVIVDGNRIFTEFKGALTEQLMTAPGAAGNTQTQFAEVLGLDSAMLKENTNVLALKQHLMDTQGETGLSLANSIWIDERFVVKDSFLQATKDYFDSEIYRRELSTEKTRKAINQWVDEETNGMIPDFLTEKLDKNTVLALMNTLYLNAKWKNEFDPNATYSNSFTKEDGSEVTTEYLRTEANMDYIKTKDAEGVILPYDDEKTIFVALRPTTETSIKDFVTSLDAASVKDYISKAESTRLDFQMPKFEYYLNP